MAKRAVKEAGQRPQARELPPVGTELAGRYRGQEVSARIVKDDDRGGAPAVECRGKRYRSLSAAARAITGNSVNGWRFWQVVEAQQGEPAWGLYSAAEGRGDVRRPSFS
jgi:hypothetical protein